MNRDIERKLEENHFRIIELERENKNILESYNGIKRDYIRTMQEKNKYKEVLDKIKEYINDDTIFDGSAMCKNDLDRILEEI